MSKFSKLILKPKLFWSDFFKHRKLNQRLSENFDSLMSADKEFRSCLEKESNDILKIFSLVILKNYKAVEMPECEEGYTQIGVMDEEKYSLIKLLSGFHDILDISIGIRKSGVFKEVNKLSYEEKIALFLNDNIWIIDFNFIASSCSKCSSKYAKNRLNSEIQSFLKSLLDDKNVNGANEFYEQKNNTKNVIKLVFWQDTGSFYETTQKNYIAKKIAAVVVKKQKLFQRGKKTSLSSILPYNADSFCQFPIDIVYTWVNNEDKNWQKMYADQLAKNQNCSLDALSLDRFYNRNELKYSLRSVDRFVPWVRKIYIVSNCSPPKWLNLNRPDIEFVDHAILFKKQELPVFNSHAIESKLHHIPELSEHFIYLNDDMFFGRLTTKEDFYASSGISYSALEDYGTVNGKAREGDPDYLNAARNGKMLIENTFGMSPTQLHTHSMFCLNRKVIDEMENKFSGQFARTGKATFRTIHDISVPSFLYHHYAYHIRMAQRRYIPVALLKISNKDLKKKIQKIKLRHFISFCINDGDSSSDNKKWNKMVVKILENIFPYKSKFEN